MFHHNQSLLRKGQQSLLFSDSLKDLKNLRTQLYSAAEYLELRYTSDDQKQIVVETLKDHASKAVVNTVDHLGSVTCKVNDLLDAKVDEVSDAEHRISCMNSQIQVSGGCSPESTAILMPSRIAKAFSIFSKQVFLETEAAVTPHLNFL
ncbi:protein ABIL3-like [Citrus sinensis]|uniref:protein ABIL3-like n=1 Tax=Citrus sinensis TaxID=2711 RepID=UPI0022775625|nr:protein ABIL3-like [Citrus sinensis]